MTPEVMNLVIPGVTAFLCSAIVFPFYIGWLKKKQIGQFIREEGPQSHAVKAKTPTMGGLCFIFVSCAVALVCLILSFNGSRFLPVAVAVVVVGCLCGLIGFVDDFSKLQNKSNKGLSARARLLIEFALGLVLSVVLYFLLADNVREIVLAPHGAAFKLNDVLLGIYLLAGVPFLIAATTNATNLHDGMDGLAAGTSLQVFVALTILFVVRGNGPLALVSATVTGSLIGFLLYNRYPAKVFMGDTGSLFIGGTMGALIAAGGLAFWFVPLAIIYIAESISVMAQVSYFKLTKPYTPDPPMNMPKLVIYKLTHRLPGEGKRLLRMAPLHHHYEAIAEEKGIPEWQVVAAFWLVQFMLCTAVVLVYMNL